MSFQVGIGSLEGNMYFQMAFCTPLRPMVSESKLKKQVRPNASY